MAISQDLFETHYYTYYDEEDTYSKSDEEKELKITSLLTPSIRALRIIKDHLSEHVIHWEGTISSGLRFQYSLLDLYIEGGGYACRLSPRFTVSSKRLDPDIQHMLEAELKRIDKEDVEAQRFNGRALDSFHFAALILRMVEAVSAYVLEYAIDILPDYRIIHVESVIRDDLARRFSERQDQLRLKLIQRPLGELTKSKKDLVEYLVTPKLTFHGTRPDLVPSIVQYGFLKPGSVHPGHCTYGRGIYSSPSSAFALAYSGAQCEATKPGGIPGLKLLVCATIMGRPVTMYRVFDNAQILPCYVVHLDWANGSEANDFIANKLARVSSSNKRPWLDTNALSCPGDVQRLKAERLAQARKFFAYGFGPVSGSKIVIEDIADIDDDEEDYGEYQTDRLDDVQKVDIWNRLDGETLRDEYNSERKAYVGHRRKLEDSDE
ncbi:hypothetical protein BT96DRAFT_914259 [Gymnopus androsaceus JB14]|uniref:PARP catalytic domain-containing protein n=1 Tax=Gymnopus androsaceus JB14 TaxID=1447944 RepID=A0A6A4IBF1_9AGAR|nr:hypothetical protein BT96DRAFT_914259 [Gymnopus androsaceus JB14]